MTGNTPTYHVGLARYEVSRDPADHFVDKVLPADPGPAHAVTLPPSRRRSIVRPVPTREPVFLDSWQYQRALCGAIVKVLLPVTFDPGDEGSCPRCVGPALRGASSLPLDMEDVPLDGEV